MSPSIMLSLATSQLTDSALFFYVKGRLQKMASLESQIEEEADHLWVCLVLGNVERKEEKKKENKNKKKMHKKQKEESEKEEESQI